MFYLFWMFSNFPWISKIIFQLKLYWKTAYSSFKITPSVHVAWNCGARITLQLWHILQDVGNHGPRRLSAPCSSYELSSYHPSAHKLHQAANVILLWSSYFSSIIYLNPLFSDFQRLRIRLLLSVICRSDAGENQSPISIEKVCETIMFGFGFCFLFDLLIVSVVIWGLSLIVWVE